MTRPYKRRTPDPDAAALLAAAVAKCAACAAGLPMRGDLHHSRGRFYECTAIAERKAARTIQRLKSSPAFASKRQK